MKQALTIIMIILFANIFQAQNNNYSDLWKEVENLESQGLPKSALKVVEQIEVLALNDKNNSQQIKVLLFKSKFALTLQEDAKLKIISEFKNQIKKSEFPTKNILENILANLYWQYFQQNRWQFYNRTKTSIKVDHEDFRTWDLPTLFNEIHLQYQNSLQNSLKLKLEDLSQFDTVLSLEKNSKIFRSTLFDFLAHNALEFYKMDENTIAKPSYKFEIDNAAFLGDALSFSTLVISSKDSTSLQLNALKLYQELVQFHLKDKEPYAVVDVNIQRLLYVNEHATFDDKEALIIHALQTESQRLNSHEAQGMYDFEIANIFYRQGLTYEPFKNEESQWKLKSAYDLCEAVINKFPKSKGALKCKVLKERILQKSLQITSEFHLPIDTNAKLLVRYKNFDTINFKVYQLTRNQHQRLNKIYRPNEQIKFIKYLKIVSQWKYTLRNENDYQSHSTEILIPPLKNGYYVVFASPEEKKDTIFSFASIQVTDIAMVDKSDESHHIYQVIDRNDGQPIVNAKGALNYRKNNYTEQSEYVSTNSKGEFSITKSREGYWQLDIEISNNSDKAYFDNYNIYQRTKEDNKERVTYRSFIFSDRSIYRPGQTVHYKGIVMKTKDFKSEVIDNALINVELYNANQEKLAESVLKTNAFGSVSGEFILPNNGLTGQFYIVFKAKSGTIYSADSMHYFSVEEYKRPKFEASFDSVTETFKVNDSVRIKGKALAYAGSNITDTKVVYRVYRKVKYPRWFYWYRPWFMSEPQEIAHGESLTDGSGNFEINFKAQPDASVDKENLPIFHYEVTADITDLNGETRSTSTTINVGYHALVATISADDNLDKSKKDHKLSIDTRNLNGESVSAQGSVRIYKLMSPSAVLRPRQWQAPDYQDLSETEFKQLFPNEAYTNEDNSNNWEKGNMVFESTFDTANEKAIELNNIKKWESGLYVIVLESKDKFGQLVKDEAKMTVFGSDDKFIADNQLFSISSNKDHYAIGDNVILKLSSAGTLTVTIDVEKDHTIIDTYIIRLNKNTKTIYLPVTKNDLGGYAIHYSYAAYNSYKGNVFYIQVPYPKSDLQIETLTFRDKLQPGEDETWSFKIKGPKGEKVSAELLASMYDMSLDQFKQHQWTFDPIQNPTYFTNFGRHAGQAFGLANYRLHNPNRFNMSYPYQGYDQLNWFGFYFGNYRSTRIRGYASGAMRYEESEVLNDEMLEEVVVNSQGIEREKKAQGYAVSKELPTPSSPEKIEEVGVEKVTFENIKIRKDLRETAFFFPQLQTDEEGHVSFKFKSPEALTKWKLQLLAHTKSLECVTSTLEAVTQKELMVIPNAPRFLREGDQITISTKIANISDKELSGSAVLQLFDALTGNEIDVKLNNTENLKSFKVSAKGNTHVEWSLSIPNGIHAVQYKVIAKAGDYSDGEQNVLPVLTNRMLVTETMPMWIRSDQTKTFSLNKLKNTASTTLKHHNLTLEMTSNPAWYAVQALPYLMEFPYECNEQIFSRFYANALASHIANSNPRIQEVFNQWKNTDALLSNLEKNQELKSLLIQETPWLRNSQSESEQKKRIGLLFDLNKMNNELQSAMRKLQNNQMNSGGWAWFNGGRENRFITQHIIIGFGHLKQLGVTNSSNERMISKAINYLDQQFIRKYKDIRKFNKDVDLNKDHLSYTQLHYLYMRSFFREVKQSKEIEEISKYYLSQIQKYWLSRPLYSKGLMALILHRMDHIKTSEYILASIKENSISSDELGMYWKENSNSWYWYQAPIETQALLIEAFTEIDNDTETIDNLKIWLLKNKQTNRWKTTKSTTEAVYALLLQGSDWLSITDTVDVVLGGHEISPTKLEDVQVEAGTGYYKTSWSSSDIRPEMADVTISKKGKGIAWGGLYWQYFEDLDKITSAETPLKLNKKLFLKKNTDLGEEITEITSKSELHVGDLVRVRIELRSDRPMEFVHMKDMRASGLEPVNVLSKYKWQDGLGYYESTKDASTNFFFDYLPKGIHIFEYDLRVNNSGDMSNGITTIQSMYAPEFSSHSEGIRLLVN